MGNMQHWLRGVDASDGAHASTNNDAGCKERVAMAHSRQNEGVDESGSSVEGRVTKLT